jgi:hypothetical protein
VITLIRNMISRYGGSRLRQVIVIGSAPHLVVHITKTATYLDKKILAVLRVTYMHLSAKINHTCGIVDSQSTVTKQPAGWSLSLREANMMASTTFIGEVTISPGTRVDLSRGVRL